MSESNPEHRRICTYWRKGWRLLLSWESTRLFQSELWICASACKTGNSGNDVIERWDSDNEWVSEWEFENEYGLLGESENNEWNESIKIPSKYFARGEFSKTISSSTDISKTAKNDVKFSKE